MYGKPGDTNLIFHVDFEVNIYVRWTFAHDVLQQSLAASDFIVNVLQMWIKSKPKTLLQDRAKCNLCKYYSSRDSVSAAYLTHLVMEELNALTDFIYQTPRTHLVFRPVSISENWRIFLKFSSPFSEFSEAAAVFYCLGRSDPNPVLCFWRELLWMVCFMLYELCNYLAPPSAFPLARFCTVLKSIRCWNANLLKGSSE